MKAIGYQTSLVHKSEPEARLCQAPWWIRSPKIGCALLTLWAWVQRHKLSDGVAATEAQRAKRLEREVNGLGRAN